MYIYIYILLTNYFKPFILLTVRSNDRTTEIKQDFSTQTLPPQPYTLVTFFPKRKKTTTLSSPFQTPRAPVSTIVAHLLPHTNLYDSCTIAYGYQDVLSHQFVRPDPTSQLPPQTLQATLPWPPHVIPHPLQQKRLWAAGKWYISHFNLSNRSEKAILQRFFFCLILFSLFKLGFPRIQKF